MKFSRLHIMTFLGLAVVAWWAVLQWHGKPMNREMLQPFGTVVGVLMIAAFALEHFLWRMQWLHGWFVKRPDLRGTWKVTIESDWIDPETCNPSFPITAYAGIAQTLSTLQMHLMTPQSESWFVADAVRPSPDEAGYQIIAVYTNKPNMHLRAGVSDMHLGAIVIDTHGKKKGKPDVLTAEYWTDRKTRGTMTLSERQTRLFTKYEQARQKFPPSTNELGFS